MFLYCYLNQRDSLVLKKDQFNFYGISIMQFTFHIFISWIIFALLASGFKFFIKLKGNFDFSYLGIVLFTSYISALTNIHLNFGILLSFFVSFLSSLPFTLLILALSERLNAFYFSIGTMTFYMLIYQLAYNLDGISWGALGISGIKRFFIYVWDLSSLRIYFVFIFIIVFFISGLLLIFRKSILYKALLSWWENEFVLKVFWTSIKKYKIICILITTFLATLAATFYTFYYLYIDPSSFWFNMLILILTIVFLSYNYNEIGTLSIGIILITIYEYLRFIKPVDASKVGYFRIILFSLLIIILAFFHFRKIEKLREQ